MSAALYVPVKSLSRLPPLDVRMCAEAGVPPVIPTGLRKGQETIIKRATYDCRTYGTLSVAFDFHFVRHVQG